VEVFMKVRLLPGQVWHLDLLLYPW
jgi:hypothetical protein